MKALLLFQEIEDAGRTDTPGGAKNCVAEACSTCHDSGAGSTACNWDCVIASETNFRNLPGLHEAKRVIRI